jgi:hypothetical protein
MRIVNNFYANRLMALIAVMRDAVYVWKSSAGNPSLKDVPAGYDSISTTQPPSGINDYHLKPEIQELAALVEQETGKVIVNAWGNNHKSNKWLGGHKHNHNPRITTVATYIVQAPADEVITFEDRDDVTVITNMLLIFDSGLSHGIKPSTRRGDFISITFQLAEK